MKTTVSATSLLLVSVLLSGCISKIDAPSLLPRPVEATRPDDLPLVAPPANIDPAQIALAARMVAQANAADTAFNRALPPGQRSGPEGSEAWITAQSARSAAEIARAPTLDALTDLDTAIATATDRGLDPAPLVKARADVQTIVDRQSARLDAISR
ncbi:MAG: hypothetical protein ABI898_01945 [Sphingomonadales bacterium]